jgi:hypothetical protein
LNAQNCDFDLVGVPSVGSFSLIPLFVDVTLDNFHLGSGSPCIGTGANVLWAKVLAQDSLVLDRDLDGNPRIVGQTIDLGCYEVP